MDANLLATVALCYALAAVVEAEGASVWGALKGRSRLLGKSWYFHVVVMESQGLQKKEDWPKRSEQSREAFPPQKSPPLFFLKQQRTDQIFKNRAKTKPALPPNLERLCTYSPENLGCSRYRRQSV